MPDYYHGSRADLEPGAVILPASMTGKSATFDEYNLERFAFRFLSPQAYERVSPYRPNRVYVSTSKHMAARYAVAHQGKLYRVEPQGELVADLHGQLDPEYADSAFTCDSARVLEAVPLTADEVADLQRELEERRRKRIEANMASWENFKAQYAEGRQKGKDWAERNGEVISRVLALFT